MAQYRVAELDLSTRVNLALEMFRPIPERQWGGVTQLAQAYSVSRTFLYNLRDQVLQAISEALVPHQPGPQPRTNLLEIDRPFLQRAITVMPMLTGTVRGIQQGLDLLFGAQRSVGYISQTLQAAGTAAMAYNVSIPVPQPVLAEADEIFQGRQPALTVVDGRSFLVLNLSPAEARDGTTWGVIFLDLQARGIQFHDLASDGGQGILAGAREAQLAIPLRPDLFHLLREAHRLTRRLEREAYGAIEVAERARRAEREAQAPKRRRGKPLQVKVPRQQAEAKEERTMATYDLWTWLMGEVRQALEPITPAGRLASVAEVQETVQTAVELLMALHHAQITAFARKLLERLEALVAPLAWLEQSLAPWRKELDAATEEAIVWAWQHRHTLALQPGEGFPAARQPVVQTFWEVLSLFHRSSSLAESLHSWLRPHLQIHRGMPKWLLALLQLFWNHHPFQRGKRAGHSPLELAGVKEASSLSEMLNRLFRPCPAVQRG